MSLTKMTDVEVHMGEAVINPGDHNLVTSGIGSCLVITLYDPKLQIGALAHTMVPSSAACCLAAVSGNNTTNYEPRTTNSDTKYVDVAINQMLKGLKARGSKKEDLEAKLIGGANMFPSLMSDDIGKDNVLSAKEKLRVEGIRIVGECIGGSQGRSVEFSPTIGVVTVKLKF